MSRTEINVPSGARLYGDVIVSYTDQSTLMEIKQGELDREDDETLEAVILEKDRLPELIAALSDAHMAWKRANSDLYRDPSTTTKGDA